MSYTLIFLVITVAVSVWAFNDDKLLNRLLLYPSGMYKPEEYYRFLTSGFVHADWMHLIFNMVSLYFIGSGVEYYFHAFGAAKMYLLLYLLGIIVSSLPSFFKHRRNAYYRSLGASGGVSAVMFSLVYISPWSTLYVFGIRMYAMVYAVLFVVFSIYMGRQNRDHINHDAHLWGALFGFAFTWLIDPMHGGLFFEQIMHPPFLR